MTAVRASTGRGSGRRPRQALGALLVVAMLVPVGVLFAQHWRDLGDGKEFAGHERAGIEYVTALNRVTAALTQAQSAAIAGQSVPRDDLAAAVEAVAAVDTRHGEDLRVHERWSQLHTTIERLTGTSYSDPQDAYDDYGEATDLLLDLYNKLRESSGLIRDADAAVYYLQDGAVEELPEAIVAAGRLADLLALGAGQSAAEQDAENVEISLARVEVESPAGDLATDLQATLENSTSRTLSSNVLSRHDQFLREKDTLLGAIPADGRIASVDFAQVAASWAGLHAAGAQLLDALVAEMDGVVADRVDQIAGRQRTAVLTVVVAVLLAGGLLAWLVTTSGRWRAVPAAERAPAAPPEPAVPVPAIAAAGTGPGDREPSSAR